MCMINSVMESGYITVEYVVYYWTETMLRVLKYKGEGIVLMPYIDLQTAHSFTYMARY